MPESEWLNLYVYPEEVDYARSSRSERRGTGSSHCVRRSDATFELPEQLRERRRARSSTCRSAVSAPPTST